MANTDSEELMWARNEVRYILPYSTTCQVIKIDLCKSQFKATLATLEADLEDLEESVKYVLYLSTLLSIRNQHRV